MLSRTFQSKFLSVSQLNIDWTNLYSNFNEKFNDVFRLYNKKLHFDYIRSKKDAKYSQIDGAKENWVDPILLDTIICILNNVELQDHRFIISILSYLSIIITLIIFNFIDQFVDHLCKRKL
jgi:hypothetical protein